MDFIPAFSDVLTIPSGQSQAVIPLTVLADTIPELNETLVVSLTSVTLLDGGDAGSLDEENAPSIGPINEAFVIILINDDPFGRFVLSVTAGGSKEARVPEAENFAVTLVVEREGGTLGDVEVSWTVVSGTAEEGVDYTGE